jgi:hypothetical protein
MYVCCMLLSLVAFDCPDASSIGVAKFVFRILKQNESLVTNMMSIKDTAPN